MSLTGSSVGAYLPGWVWVRPPPHGCVRDWGGRLSLGGDSGRIMAILLTTGIIIIIIIITITIIIIISPRAPSVVSWVRSPLGFMRCRANWVMRRFHDVPFTDGEHLQQAVAAVMRSLCDPCLPVRYQAATSIRDLVLLEVGPWGAEGAARCDCFGRGGGGRASS
jgi:hypothetical protein